MASVRGIESRGIRYSIVCEWWEKEVVVGATVRSEGETERVQGSICVRTETKRGQSRQQYQERSKR